jgi:hypothetical protein
MTDTRTLIQRLLDLSSMAVDQALNLEYDDPDDYHIYRELQELRSMVAEWMERRQGEAE